MRYQLASLQKIMRANAVGLPEPVGLSGFLRQPANGHGHANGHGKRPRTPAPSPESPFTLTPA